MFLRFIHTAACSYTLIQQLYEYNNANLSLLLGGHLSFLLEIFAVRNYTDRLVGAVQLVDAQAYKPKRVRVDSQSENIPRSSVQSQSGCV